MISSLSLRIHERYAVVIEEFLQNGAIISLKGGLLLLGWGKEEWREQPSSAPSFYFPDYFLENKMPWLCFENYQILHLNELKKQLGSTENHSSVQWTSPFENVYKEQFFQLKEQILKGTILKAVPYTFFKAEGAFDVNASLNQLLDQATKFGLYLYGFWDESEGMLGGTPELLFSKSHHAVSSDAIAGTARLDVNDEVFLNDEKQLQEHEYVVEGIVESLKQLGKVEKQNRRVVRFAGLKHISTSLNVQLERPISFETIVTALHPTPALGVFPKQNDWQWLKQYAGAIPRGRYGAPAGYVLDDEAACYVAIRNVQWKNHSLTLGAGGGVVSDSQFEQEWEEILLKASSIREQLAI